MVLRQIQELTLNENVILKNTLENPENREIHFKNTNRTTVPCLYIDGVPMFESRDICTWLANNKEKIIKG